MIHASVAGYVDYASFADYVDHVGYAQVAVEEGLPEYEEMAVFLETELNESWIESYVS